MYIDGGNKQTRMEKLVNKCRHILLFRLFPMFPGNEAFHAFYALCLLSVFFLVVLFFFVSFSKEIGFCGGFSIPQSGLIDGGSYL